MTFWVAGQVIDKIKERILTEENLRELVRLVNEKMDTGASETRQRLEAVTAEIADVHRRLGRLYDALETGKLTLNDLATRIQSLRHQEDQLQAVRLELEELLTERRIQLADEKVVRSYVEDLKEVLLTYTMPLSPEGSVLDTATVLDTVHYGGAGVTIGRTFELAFSLSI